MSLSLKVRGPSSPSAIGLVVSSTSTWSEFLHLLREELKLKAEFDVLSGFPATVMTCEDSQVVGQVLNTNESIRVQLRSSAGVQLQGESKPKRSVKTAKPTSVRSSSAGKTLGGFGANIVSIKQSPVKKSFLSSGPSKRSRVDGPSSSIDTAPKRRRKSSSSAKISSEGDIAEHLLSAVSGGAGTQNRVARKVFRNAVAHQYNSTQAVSRVNAIFSGDYTIRECGGTLLSSSSAARPVHTHIEITYRKGGGSRGFHVDTVELLSKELLLGVLAIAVVNEGTAEEIEEGREALKPMNLSRCSPRIFWSIVHHYGPDLVGNIKRILKGVDNCEWLDERKRELSEKARINLLQKEELEQRRRGNKRKPDSKGLNTTESEQSNESPDVQGSAALKEAAGIDPTQTWLSRKMAKLLPLEDFIPEEWREAVKSFLESQSCEGSVLSLFSFTANISKLRSDLLKCRSELSKSSIENSIRVDVVLSSDQLEGWLVSAQVSAFHIIWRIICGGGSERLRSALHQFRIRKPRDFYMWRNGPEGLLEGLLDIDSQLESGVNFVWENIESGTESGENLNSEIGKVRKLDVLRISWMCRVALSASTAFPWMNTDGLGDLEDDESDQFKEDEAEAEVGASGEGAEDSEEDGWLHELTAHEYVGRRIRIDVTNGYWEDGVVVGYLPPEPDEPMALWKVKLDAPVPREGKTPKDRFEDLEEEEIKEALEYLQNVENK